MIRYPNFLKRPFFRFHVPVIFLAAAIFIFSSIPKLTPPNLGFELQDKFYHFLVYAIFGFLVARSFFSLKFSENFHKYYLLFAILFSAIYGLSDEIHQSYVPGRFSSIGDFIADSSGSAVGVLIFHYRRGLKLFLTKYMPLKK